LKNTDNGSRRRASASVAAAALYVRPRRALAAPRQRFGIGFASASPVRVALVDARALGSTHRNVGRL
jgi:hypothetical protein